MPSQANLLQFIDDRMVDIERAGLGTVELRKAAADAHAGKRDAYEVFRLLGSMHDLARRMESK